MGVNEIGKWLKLAAESVGIDINSAKISNHSLRATAISELAKKGIGETQLIKISGHSNVSSFKPYIQMDKEHHQDIILKLRNDTEENNTNNFEIQSANKPEPLKNNQAVESYQKKRNQIVYNNCVFNCTSVNN